MNENGIEDTNLLELPKHIPNNPYNYTALQIASRKKELKQMEIDYPNLPYGFLEMIWDFSTFTPKDELDEIIKSGRWEVPGDHTNKKVKYSEEMSKEMKAPDTDIGPDPDIDPEICQGCGA